MGSVLQLAWSPWSPAPSSANICYSGCASTGSRKATSTPSPESRPCVARCRMSRRPIPLTWFQAERLLAELPSGLEAARADYLGAHLRALACAGRKFAGEDVGFVDEVAAYFDVHIAK